MKRPDLPNVPAASEPRPAPASDNPACSDAATRDTPRLNTAQLFRHCNEIVIEHRGEHYRLRLTRQDKLILTK